MREQVRKGLINNYIRGFRAAVTGDDSNADEVDRLPTASYAKGYAEGVAALTIAADQAERHAEAMVEEVFGESSRFRRNLDRLGCPNGADDCEVCS